MATDGSSSAKRAGAVAADLAKAAGATLSIITVGGTESRAELMQLARAEGNAADALDVIANKARVMAWEDNPLRDFHDSAEDEDDYVDRLFVRLMQEVVRVAAT